MLKTMLVKPFSQISKADAAIAGGKGASLGEMTQAGIPVPPGFVILSDAFKRFLEETDLNVEIDTILHSVDHREMHTIENASGKIQTLILGAKMPEDIATTVKEFYKELGAQYVAVRSSATAEDSASAAWAGQLDSFLNTTDETLLTNVQKCWASLFTPRAIFYRFEKELHKQKISVAVVVQKMVESECSGIAFSVHPVTEDRNQLIIEAGFGLGEAIVSGSITPDSYVVEKEPRRIIDTNVSVQIRALYRADSGGNEWKDIPEPRASSQVLTETQILELSELILRIENHYGFPCDIEWAFEDGIFYVTQSRPITTLKEAGSTVEKFETRLNELASLPWSKKWEAPLSLYVIYAGVGGYFEPMVRNRGYSFTKVLIDSKEGTSGCYLLDTDQDEFAQLLLKEIDQYPDVLNKWAQQLKDTGDKLASMYSHEASWFLDPTNHLDFGRAIDSFGVCLVTVTQIVDKLGTYLYKKYAPVLEDARGHTQRLFFDIEEVVNGFLKIIGDREGYGIEEMNACSASEIQNYLKGSQLPEKESLIVRHTRSAVLFTPEPELLSGEAAEKLIRKMTERAYHGGALHGQTAYAGFVRGKCRVIKNYKIDTHLEEGDILVTGMTDPRFVPMMQKASAIITDAGGILSHAAIVSRELKIPCVIGTKVATQVLKDGDIIEVDADNGVVRVRRAGFTNSELEHLKPEEWHFYGLWRQEVFSTCFWQTCFDQNVLRRFGFDVEMASTMIANGGNFFYRTRAVEDVHEQVARQLSENNLDSLRMFSEEAKKIYLAGIAFARETAEGAPLTVEYFEAFLSHGRQMSLYWWFAAVHLVVSAERLLQDKVVEHRIPVQEVPHLVPKIETPLLEQQTELVRLKAKIANKKIDEIKKDYDLHNELEAFRKKYAWIEIANWVGEELTFERAIDLIRNAKEDFEEPVVDMPVEVERVAQCMGYVGYAKQAGAEYVAMYEYLMMSYLQKLAKHLGLTYREMMKVTHEEIRKVLSGRENDLKDIANSESRKNTRWIAISIPTIPNGMRLIEDPKDSELVEDQMVPHADRNVREIKGEIGNRGKFIGTVRVVMNVDDFHKMQPNDVLVTTMTTPDFVILMQKAGAIVTDIGGMLCHAAIVSREINRPCIIGTKFATQVLKDGDTVEVDANNGIVRILEKATQI